MTCHALTQPSPAHRKGRGLRLSPRRTHPPIPSPSKGEGKGEGASSTFSLCSCQDGSQYGIGVPEDVVVPEPEDAVSGISQISRPLRIGCSIDHMLGVIKLDDKSRLQAHKINDIAANRMLTPELETTELARSDVLPDQALGICRTPPQTAGERRRRPRPHPHPLPLAGEGDERAASDA
jgi:hypothetical protein